MNTYEQHSRLKLMATVVTILVIAGLVVLTDHLKSSKTGATDATRQSTANPATSDTTSTPTTSTSTSTVSVPASSGYKDGTYTASTSYSVPPGRESIQVSLTLADGVVTSASVQNSENDFDSAQYQEEFTAGYKTQVIGKKISGLQIQVIAGASDTTEGFNTAVDKIAAQAQA